jgi:hypothetical protein
VVFFGEAAKSSILNTCGSLFTSQYRVSPGFLIGDRLADFLFEADLPETLALDEAFDFPGVLLVTLFFEDLGLPAVVVFFLAISCLVILHLSTTRVC